MENTPPLGDFLVIMADLESENLVANVAAIDQASALIAGGKLPEPLLLRRLIIGLASNMAKPQHENVIKLRVQSTLKAIMVAVMSNQMNMDPSACGEALHVIRCCLMDISICRIQRHTSMVRLWTVQDQLIAVKVISVFFHSSPENINDNRCVTAFASLMLSPHITVVYACAGTLSLLSLVPGFTFAIVRAYCNLLEAFPPQSTPEICRVVLILETLKQISMRMVDHPRFDDMAMDVLRALKIPNLDVRKVVLNTAVSFLTPVNVGDVLRLLMSELDLATADIPIEYLQMLQEAIRECHPVYSESIMQFILDPKYLVFSDCIRYIKDIIDCNPLLRAQLQKSLLRALRHVKSSPVCAAALWGISMCSESLFETRGAMFVISRLFDDLLDRYYVEKLIRGGGEMEFETRDCYGVKEGEHLQQCLMEMEELLFVHIGLRRQPDGSYAIASSSKNSASSEDVPSLNYTDNLTFLVQSGDVLLADFVENMLSKIL
ncbi:hypothetical protein HU200_065444 [Digitaria exilis]|uniref:Clathrin/coatomer adaptor adaptin-like N-terminal domain-containing protein n=1 Tax=Digitaria exilis TaxID=1010633 RepID=A0A835A437_9POAL|nr:hypothetical protein HU200_065444 [Digitaria exilis]